MTGPDEFFDWLDRQPTVVVDGLLVLLVIAIVVANVVSALFFLRLIGAL